MGVGTVGNPGKEGLRFFLRFQALSLQAAYVGVGVIGNPGKEGLGFFLAFTL